MFPRLWTAGVLGFSLCLAMGLLDVDLSLQDEFPALPWTSIITMVLPYDLDSRLCPSWLDAEGIGPTLASPSCESSPDLTAPRWLGAHGWLQIFSSLGQPRHTAVLWWEHEARRSCTELSRFVHKVMRFLSRVGQKKKSKNATSYTSYFLINLPAKSQLFLLDVTPTH